MNIIDTYSLMFLYRLATLDKRNIGIWFYSSLYGWAGYIGWEVLEITWFGIDIQVGNQLGIW